MGVGVGGISVGTTMVTLGLMTDFGTGFRPKIKYNREMETAKIKVIKMFFTILIIISTSVVLGGCGNKDLSGIEVITQPSTKLKIDGKEAGMTPYNNRSLKPGLISLKVGQEGIGFFSKQLELKNNISTVISWTFGKNEDSSGGYILSMEKSSENVKSLIVSSSPSKAIVLIAGENRGLTPMYITDLGEGDKEIKITMPGYNNINLGIRPVVGHQIVLEAILAKEEKVVVATPTPENVPINSSGKIKILKTDTGWLRVRDMPNSAGLEIDKVNTGEIYDSVGDSGEWTHIIVREKQGWVSTKFVEKLN